MDSGPEPLRGGDLAGHHSQGVAPRPAGRYRADAGRDPEGQQDRGGDGAPEPYPSDRVAADAARPVDGRADPVPGPRRGRSRWSTPRPGLTAQRRRAPDEPAVRSYDAVSRDLGAPRGHAVGLHRRPRGPRLGARRAAANLLIGCTGANQRAVTERDRSRYASAGALMLLTAGLAAYAGASVAAFGFHTTTIAALPYGLFYAAFIFFIDRSVLLTIRPLRVAGKGDKERVRPSRLLPTGLIRIFIAVIGAILVGETLLLRFFDTSIQPKVAELRQQEMANVLAAWDANQREAESRLVADLADQRAQLGAAQDLVTAKTTEVDCQLTGGNGCLGGRGPIYQVKLGELQAATAQIPAKRAAVARAQGRLDEFRATRDARRAGFADAEWKQIGGANDLLMRERGFWKLTAGDTSVKVWRILISLLILGIDLAPLLFKRNLDRTAYARAERSVLWEGETNESVDAHQLNRNARARRGRADDVADRMAGRYEEYALAREEMRLAAALDEDAEATALRRDERWLGHDRQAADLRRAHRLPAPTVPAPPGAPDPQASSLPTAAVPTTVPRRAEPPVETPGPGPVTPRSPRA